MKLRTKISIYPWTCWSVAALLYLLQYGLFIFPSTITTQLQQSLFIDPTEVGIVSSAYLCTYMIMQIPAGLLFDKYSVPKLLNFSALLLIVGCLLMADSSGLVLVVLSRMILGLGGSFVFVGTIYLSRSWFSAKHFPIAVGLTEAMSGLGAISLAALFSGLITFQQWQTIILEIAVVIALVVVLITLHVRDRRTLRSRRAVNVKLGFQNILSNKMLWLLGFFVGFEFSHFTVMTGMWGIPFFEFHYRVPEIDAVMENSMGMIGFTLGCILIGFQTNYFSDKKIVLIGAILQLVTIIFIYFFDLNMILQSILLFILGVATSSVVLCFNIAKKIVPESYHGLVMGFINMFFNGIGVFLTPLVGYLLQITGYRHHAALLPILLASFFAVVVSVSIIFYKDSKLSDLKFVPSLG